ncbi:uncharacterized protein LOC144148352 [Haemaphysalis longicornis]
MPPNNPLQFFIQVRKHFGKCFRSNNVFLILLPCPRPLCDLVYNVCASLRFLLLMAGDVESNPGPEFDELVEQLKRIAGDIKEIKAGKAETNEKQSAIDKKLEKIASLEDKVTDCVNRIADLECSMAVMAKKLDDLENRSRRSNLIVYGVSEQEHESPEQLETAVVKEVFNDVLDVSISGVERIHRLGRAKQGDEPKPRPVILKLVDYRDKANILKNCSKSKGSSISVSEDFSQPVREIRRKLWAHTKENRDRKEKVYLVYDKVKVEGQLFSWDESCKKMVAIPKNDNETATQKKAPSEARVAIPKNKETATQKKHQAKRM